MDERLSSDEAESIINEQSGSSPVNRVKQGSVFPDKAQVDMISAQLILQSWMTQNKDATQE